MMLHILALVVVLTGPPSADGPPPASYVDVVPSTLAPAPTRGDLGSVSAPAGLLAGPWPGFRQNAARTGQARESGPMYPSRAWNYDMGGSTYSSPAVGEDGTVYVGSADSIYAIAPDGRRRWAVPVGGYAISSPAIGEDGSIYVGSRDRRLYALRARDGSFKWAPFVAGDEIWSSPAIGTDGTIYVGSFDGNLYALNPSTGTPRWIFPIGSKIVSSPAIGADGTIYVGALDKNLYAITPNGSEKWTFPTEGDIVSSPAVASDGTIYVGSLDGSLYAVQPNGVELWETPFRTNDKIVSSPALAANGTIYVGSLDKNLYAVQRDGTSLWTFQADERIMSSPAVDAQGTLFVGTYSGQFYALNQDGTPRWSLMLPGRIWSSPAIGAGRRLYVASTDDEPFTGRLHAVHSVAFQVSFRTDPVDGVGQVVEVSRPTDFVPTSGRLFYRRGGERTFRPPVPLRFSNSTYEGDIPAEDVTIRGLEYYVELTDGDAVATYPPVDPHNHPATQSVRIGQSIMAAVTLHQSEYAMISVPLVLDDPGVQTVLEDDYGPYVPTNWRLLRWERGEYREYPTTSANFKPGAAFFLIVRNGSPFDVEEGAAVDPSTPYRIDLQPGWNQIANPFAFPVAMNTIERNESALPATAYWNGNEMCQEPSCIDIWQPWEGYFMFNNLDESESILVHPIEADTIASAAKNEPYAGSPWGPRLRLVARMAGTSLQDSQNWIGFSTETDGAEAFNIPEAPPFGEHVRLSVVDGESRYAGSFQPLNPDGATWELELSHTSEGTRRVEVAVAFEEALPEEFHISIIDRDRDQVIPLVGRRFSINTEGGQRPRRLSVIIGTDAFGEAEIGDAPTRPLSFSLDQNYPNPFNPQTVIRYEIAESGHVDLAVYDVTGRRVRTLVTGTQVAGDHETSWDGLSDSGDPAASGVYFYRMSSGESTLAKKMLLLR